MAEKDENDVMGKIRQKIGTEDVGIALAGIDPEKIRRDAVVKAARDNTPDPRLHPKDFNFGDYSKKNPGVHMIDSEIKKVPFK